VLEIGWFARVSACGVQGAVGTRGELVERVPVLERRQPHTHGRPRVPLRQISRHLVKPPPGALEVGARERAEELVASVADDKVVRPQPGSQRHGHVAEQLVAGGVALRVVGRLERVDVDEGEDESSIRAADPVDLELEIENAAIASKRSGQAVNARMPAVVLGLAPIASRPLTITRCLGPVVGCLLAVAGCLLALVRREASARPFTFVGRAVAGFRRPVASLGRAVALIGRAVPPVGRQARLRHIGQLYDHCSRPRLGARLHRGAEANRLLG